MGQKVHPEGLRVGYIHDWKSTWFNEKDFSDYLLEDIHIRDHIENKLAHAGLSTITIKKNKNEVEVNIHTARPGIVIGKSGSEVDALRKELHKMTGKAVKVNILEIKRPELDARLVAQSIAEQLQNRVAFGRAPLHTLRADIDYGFYEARTTFGRIGVKVWINKGEIMPKGFAQDLTELEAPETVGPGGGRGRGGPGGRGGGLKALERGWITNRQIEAARIAMTRKIKRGGKVWINIFPDKPYTKKPAETRMGSGKGTPEGWVAVVKPGRVMFELSGVAEPLAREAMRLAGHKLPVKTKFVMREGAGQG